MKNAGWCVGLGLAFAAARAAAFGAPAVELYAVRPESRARFVVHARDFFFPETVRGRDGRMAGEIRLVEGPAPTVSAGLTISAATLKSGLGARDSAMLGTLKAKAFPDIYVAVSSVDPFRLADLDGVGVTVTARGSLTVAGVSVPLAFPVFVQRQGKTHLLAEGLAPTGFRALKLKAPGMGFLVAVRDAIAAGADIVADRVR